MHIHTAPLRREGRLALDAAGLAALAARAPNYTGAELEAVVRAAISRAVVASRGKGAWAVGMAELEAGLADVRPAFGDANGREALQRMCDRATRARGADDGATTRSSGRMPDCADDDGIIIFGLAELCERVRRAAQGEMGGGPFAVLVRGAGGQECARARTRAAVTAARAADAPLLRVLAADEPWLLGKRPAERAEALSRAVREAHRSPVSCVVLEHIDRLAGAHVVREPKSGSGGAPAAVARVDFERELLSAVMGALTARPREPAHVCVLVCTCASEAVCDALFMPGPGEEPLFDAVLDVGS